MNIEVRADGSFDIISGDIALYNGYPCVDGKQVRPVSVTVETDDSGTRKAAAENMTAQNAAAENMAAENPAASGSVCYALASGKITVRYTCDGSSVTVSAAIEGLSGSHDVSVLGCLEPGNCDRAFYQGFGMCGPSGFTTLSDTASFDSNAVTAIGNDTECIVFCVEDQRRFRSHYTMENGRLSAVIDGEGTFADVEMLPEITITSAPTFDAGLRDAAQKIASFMGARPLRVKEEPAFHWCSWYYLYHTLDQTTLEDYLKGFSAYRDRFPFTHIQIDAGYFPSCGDWLKDYYRFPQGLKHAADTIRAAGYEPGIWIGPFMVGDESDLAKDHPDWLLRYSDGSYVTPWVQYNEPKPWGYRDSHYYVLDTSHPEAFAYIRNVFRTLRAWGYTLFKTDFLLWGIQDSAKVLRHTPGKTSFEYFREFMAMVREEIGEDTKWLGCIAPFMPSVGFVDMMRIAGDVGAQWEETGFGPENMLCELNADQYFNNVYWQNDPDAIMIRDFHIHIHQPQIDALALLEAMSGGTMYTSDPIHLIGEDRRDLLEFIRPSMLVRADYPRWHAMDEVTLIVNHLAQGSLVYWFNPTDRVQFAEPDWEAFTPAGETCLREYHGGCSDIEHTDHVKLAPRSGRLFFVSKAPLAEEPRNMWQW